MAIDMSDPLWEIVFENITAGSCILVTGPNIGITDPEKTINKQLKDLLKDKYPNGVKHYEDDEFFSFNGAREETLATHEIIKYYKELKPNDIHYKIADIPFRLVISVSPDHLLKDVYVEKKFDHTFDFYNKKQNPAAVDYPTQEKPLLYNLFGTIENRGSLIFTYDDLFDYLIQLFGDFKLPENLRQAITDASHVLFVGFDFEKWYFKLLLRLLTLNKKDIKIASAKDKNIHSTVLSFYQDEFKMDFTEYNEEEILEAAYEKCKEKGLTRSKTIPTLNSSAEIFISYAWGGESEEIANSIEKQVSARGMKMIRDKKDLGYTGDIRNFMKNIGKGKYVIVVISDKYLRSENCMFELLEIVKSGDIYNRIYPIVVSDANIYDDMIRIDYSNYWNDKTNELNEKIRNMPNMAGSGPLIEKLNQFSDIQHLFVQITSTLGNMNSLTPALHKENDFSDILNALEKKINEDAK